MKSRLAVSLMFAVCFAVALDAQDKRPANPVRAVGRVIALTPSEITVQTGKQPNLVLMIDTGTKVVGKECRDQIPESQARWQAGHRS